MLNTPSQPLYAPDKIMDALQDFRRAAARVQVQAVQPQTVSHPVCPIKVVRSDTSEIAVPGMRYQSRREFVDFMRSEIEPLSRAQNRRQFLADLERYEEEYDALDRYHRQQQSLSMLDVSGRRSLARVFRDSGRPPPPGFSEKYDREWAEREHYEVMEQKQAEAASQVDFYKRAVKLRTDHHQESIVAQRVARLATAGA